MAPWNGPKYGQKVASCGLELSSSITRTALTFDPESLDAGFQRGSLETDTAERQQKDSEKEDLAGVRLYETAESKQAPLQMPADPQGTLTSGRLALHETERERERESLLAMPADRQTNLLAHRMPRAPQPRQLLEIHSRSDPPAVFTVHTQLWSGRNRGGSSTYTFGGPGVWSAKGGRSPEKIW